MFKASSSWLRRNHCVKMLIGICIVFIILRVERQHKIPPKNEDEHSKHKLSYVKVNRPNAIHPLKEEERHKDNFQRVANETDVLVYSAYLFERNQVIRVIGLAKLEFPTLYCLLVYNDTYSKSSKANITMLPEHHGRKYRAVYIDCAVEKSARDIPKEVSISKTQNINKARQILRVNTIPKTSPRRNFTLCLSPIHSFYKNKWRLLEWLELNLILGVEQVNVYVYSCSDDVMHLLQKYQAKGYVNILKWSLPIGNLKKSEVHYFGQMAALNDCLYRTKGYSSYIAVLDVDEFIIPQNETDKTWNDILKRLPISSAYIFRSVYYVRNDTSRNTSGALVTQSGLLRDSFIFGSHKRSKYIAKVDKVETMGIHFIWKLIDGSEHTVDPSVGLVHHYRQRFRGTATTNGSFVTDKYFHELKKRIERVSTYS